MDTVSVFHKTSSQYITYVFICAALKPFFSLVPKLILKRCGSRQAADRQQNDNNNDEKNHVHGSLDDPASIAEKCPATLTQLHSHPTSAASQLRI